MKKIKFLVGIGLIFAFSVNLYSVPAYPYPVTVKQPDGTTLSVVLKGDEFHHFYTTEDGVFIVKNSQGVFNYAKLNTKGELIDTQVKANDGKIRSVSERTFINQLNAETDLQAYSKMMRAKSVADKRKTALAPSKFPLTGTPRSLVILVNFKDIAFVVPNPKTAFTDLLNKTGYSDNGGTGSAKDYFVTNSMGTFTPQFDVVGPFTLPQNVSYYGENDTSGDDKNPVQMVVDACTLAAAAGVDFSIYDTDNNGIVDNVFIYYAGYNEAEHAPANTIWPHRWGIYPTAMYGADGNYTGTVPSVTFSGKRVEDYACTSELRGSSGASMAGIGTFTHEFGHVLGLADMYATDGGTHHTLDYWNIMDAGAYLNQGRTPPAYNAFERMQLGYLTPTLLTGLPQNLTLNPLIESNQAFLISPTDGFKMVNSAPVPTEFFLFENRQKTSWDTYLPGHGMLIYRVNYNQQFWDYNIPNNDPAIMGVDIIEADGIASTSTLSGDPFPGTSNVSSYDLVLQSGVKLYKRLDSITETNSLITFHLDLVREIAASQAAMSFTSFVNSSSTTQSITITTANLLGQELNYEIVGQDSLMFSVSGTGTLPLSGGVLNILFMPTSEGAKTAALKITDGNITQQIPLFGTANLPPLGVPVVPADANTILADSVGFTAVWQKIAEADSYQLNVYTKEEGSLVYTEILNENFDKFILGAPNGNTSGTDISGSLNSYTQTPGWVGAKVFEAGGSVKLGSSSGLGYLITPALDLSRNGGNFTLRFDAMAWSGDATSMKIYINNTLTYTIKDLNNTASYVFKTYSLDLTGGSNSVKIGFEGNQLSRGRFFLDNLVVSQGSTVQNIPILNSPFTTSELSYYVKDLTFGKNYYYTVNAKRGTQLSDPSQEVGPIGLVATGVHTVPVNNLSIQVKNGKLIFDAFGGESVEIYNLMGQKLLQTVAESGLNELSLNAKGVVIVRVGDRVGKVML